MNRLNRIILKQAPGVSRTYFSADYFEPGDAETEGDAETYPPDFLHNLEPQGLSVHQPDLKIGVPVSRILLYEI